MATSWMCAYVAHPRFRMLAENELNKAEIKETDMEPSMVEACIDITCEAQKRYVFDKVFTRDAKQISHPLFDVFAHFLCESGNHSIYAAAFARQSYV
uniref:Uncharacterized protein n=1 Tax=Parascaris univalens TaxID=6257 RepID=A0A915BBB3_PARUN